MWVGICVLCAYIFCIFYLIMVIEMKDQNFCLFLINKINKQVFELIHRFITSFKAVFIRTVSETLLHDVYIKEYGWNVELHL